MSESTTTFLNRWLDKTPLRQLERTKTFIVVPSFNVNCVWKGFSDLIGIYDYTAPNNFTLRNLAGLPLNTNYSMIISYVNSNRTIKRFKLIRGVGEVIYGDIPQYSGQVIKKKFRVEIWSSPTSMVSQSTNVVLNASVLNAVDYRMGVDTVLTSENNFTTEFGNTSTGLPDLTNCILRFKGSDIVKDGSNHVTSWPASVSAITLLPTGVPTYRSFGYVEGAQCLGTAILSGSQVSTLDIKHLYVQFFSNIGVPSNNDIMTMQFASDPPLFELQRQIPPVLTPFTNHKATVDSGSLLWTSLDGANILELDAVNGTMNAFDWPIGTLNGVASGLLAAQTIDSITLGDAAGLAGSASIVCQILGYSALQTPAARLKTLEYLTGTPFIWPYVPVLNSDSLSL